METKNTQNHEDRRLDLIESLHMKLQVGKINVKLGAFKVAYFVSAATRENTSLGPVRTGRPRSLCISTQTNTNLLYPLTEILDTVYYIGVSKKKL